MRLPLDIRLRTTHLERTHTSVLPHLITVHRAVILSRLSYRAPGPLRPTPCLVRRPTAARARAVRLPFPVLPFLRTEPGPCPAPHHRSPALPPTLRRSHVPVRHRLSLARRLSRIPAQPSLMLTPCRGLRASAEGGFSLGPSSRRCCCCRPMGSAVLPISRNRTPSLTR
jgi:hypothetical protein